MQRIKDKKVKFLLANPSKITIPKKTLISINGQGGVSFILHKDGDRPDFKAICVNEDSIYEAFTDFVESIEDSGLTYSPDDSLVILSDMISEI